MSGDLIRVDFEGRSVALNLIDGAEWATSKVVAEMLGYRDSRKVVRLFRQYRAELTAGREYAEVTLDVAGSVPNSGPQRRAALVFSLRGIEFLAMMCRTPVGVRVRKWVVDRMEAERNGTARLVSMSQVDALRAQVEKLSAALIESQVNHAKDLRSVAEQLMATNDKMASAFGAALAHRKGQKRHQAALKAELDIGQRFLGGLGPNGGAHAVSGN